MIEDKREAIDRRTKPTSPISRYSFLGRRKENRRTYENQNYYVDQYELKYWIVVLFILILCITDAILTLKLLQHGGIEMNPFMAYLIKKDAALFLIVKILITSVNVVILLVHKNFHVFGNLKISYIIYSVFFIYFLLILYEIFLFLRYIY